MEASQLEFNLAASRNELGLSFSSTLSIVNPPTSDLFHAPLTLLEATTAEEVVDAVQEMFPALPNTIYLVVIVHNKVEITVDYDEEVLPLIKKMGFSYPENLEGLSVLPLPGVQFLIRTPLKDTYNEYIPISRISVKLEVMLVLKSNSNLKNAGPVAIRSVVIKATNSTTVQQIIEMVTLELESNAISQYTLLANMGNSNVELDPKNDISYYFDPLYILLPKVKFTIKPKAASLKSTPDNSARKSTIVLPPRAQSLIVTQPIPSFPPEATSINDFESIPSQELIQVKYIPPRVPTPIENPITNNVHSLSHSYLEANRAPSPFEVENSQEAVEEVMMFYSQSESIPNSNEMSNLHFPHPQPPFPRTPSPTPSYQSSLQKKPSKGQPTPVPNLSSDAVMKARAILVAGRTKQQQQQLQQQQRLHQPQPRLASRASSLLISGPKKQDTSVEVPLKVALPHRPYSPRSISRNPSAPALVTFNEQRTRAEYLQHKPRSQSIPKPQKPSLGHYPHSPPESPSPIEESGDFLDLLDDFASPSKNLTSGLGLLHSNHSVPTMRKNSLHKEPPKIQLDTNEKKEEAFLQSVGIMIRPAIDLGRI